MIETCITLNTVPRAAIVDAFNDAFAEYEVPVRMTEDRFETMSRSRSIRFEHSFGIAIDGKLAAFILNGSRTIDGVLTANNSGTGVRRAFQSQGHGRRLLRETMTHLIALGYRRYTLEVLAGNTAAISLYTQHRFVRGRTLNCYEVRRSGATAALSAAAGIEGAVSVSPIPPGWQRRVAPAVRYAPSWQNAGEAIAVVSERCSLVLANDRGIGRDGDSVAAFAVIDRRIGNLMQFGFVPGAGKSARAVLLAAGRAAKTDTIRHLNVDGSAGIVCDLLVGAGFRPTATQYEMELTFPIADNQ